MQVEIFNVDHGSCALVTTPENQHILMDCGSSSASLLTRWHPGRVLSGRGIYLLDELVVSHADEDHVSGLQSILDANVSIGWIETNDSLTPQVIRALKPEAPGPAVTLLLRKLAAQDRARAQQGLLSAFAPTPPTYSIDKCGYRCTFSAQGGLSDINNLSLVTFLSCGGLRMVFPGDIEELGWTTLLRDPAFCERLGLVNIFVASHHGRRNGYFADVFNHCSPELVVFSDSSIVHNTQNTSALYRQHTSGVLFGDNVRRHVLTTRNNGHMTFTSTAASFNVNVSRA